MTGVICPGCGITRACLSLARGEFAGAWSYHPFAYLLVPLAIAIALFPRKTKQAWSRVPKIPRRLLLAVTLAACLALWIARLN